GMMPSDMEIAAARDALSRTQIDPKEIDLLITFSQLPDYLSVPTAAALHAALELNEWCLSLSTDSACNSFQTQLSLAEQMIKGGRARHALLVQSSTILHLIRPEEQHSAWFGDGAAAAVVGPVGEGKGILSACHRTDGSFYKALVGGCPNGGRWFDGDKIEFYIHDRDAAVRLVLSLPEIGRQVVEKALGEAGYRADQVDFYASHQGTHWLRRVTQEHIGLNRARYFDSYEFTTSLTASNLPFVMAMAEREGILRDGDLVAMFSGGSGITVSGTVLRWGL
ncbi:MAG: 3-oxoacyl-ACP synthase III family protein, partial [Acidimicrobiia bacterium]